VIDNREQITAECIFSKMFHALSLLIPTFLI